MAYRRILAHVNVRFNFLRLCKRHLVLWKYDMTWSSIWKAGMRSYLNYLYYLHSNYFPRLCCFCHVSTVIHTDLPQMSVDLGSLRGISKRTLDIIYKGKWFSFRCSCLRVYHLVFINYCSVIARHDSTARPKDWTHSNYIAKFAKKCFHLLGFWYLNVTPSTKLIFVFFRENLEYIRVTTDQHLLKQMFLISGILRIRVCLRVCSCVCMFVIGSG